VTSIEEKAFGYYYDNGHKKSRRIYH